MTDGLDVPIVSPEDIRERARVAFSEGKRLSDNPYNWHARAHLTWNEEWLRLAAARTRGPHRRAPLGGLN